MSEPILRIIKAPSPYVTRQGAFYIELINVNIFK
ncbi:hypothetical protein DFO70_10440 [Cytobacillus firmus]|uniref:Uncharacterized protein n=2 Tax=Cytobacillus TaxID=2675230 RepID=A0A366K1H3_CYTFI|nr:hypothetical protein DFO70_10440 [Cytobacillus firmus]TDX43148.1 hypothetical protein DFO72_10543 [Cytobacillus oceanisediminis]